jgi:hypothetical protein
VFNFVHNQVPDFDDFKSFLSIVGLLSLDFEDVSESSSEVLVHGCDSGLLKLLLCAIYYYFFSLFHFGISKNTHIMLLLTSLFFFFFFFNGQLDHRHKVLHS